MASTKVTLKPGREITAPRGHPWIFSGAVQKTESPVADGDFVQVYSDKGRWLAAGHWGTQGIGIRILSRVEGLSERDIVFGAIKSAIAYRKRLGLFDDKLTDSFRLVHGEGDSLSGLIVDKYAEACVVQFHTKGMSRIKDIIESALCSEGMTRVVFRSAFENEETRESELITIQEGGVKFRVDLVNGQKTGFFLDQRENRRYLRSIAPGAEILNAFSYTGGFSMHALSGSAKRVVSLDVSGSALRLAAENAELNKVSDRHQVIEADCFHYFAESKEKFDIVVLDPPAFVKHKNAYERGLKGYKDINKVALKCVKPGGILLTFSCSQLVSLDDFTECVRRAAQEEGRFMRIAKHLTQAPCHPVNIFHPEGAYLKGLVLYLDQGQYLHSFRCSLLDHE